MAQLIPAPNTVELRLYGVGLGDCFLLAFPGEDKPCYVVIDCGIAKGTPNEKTTMQAVVEDIIDATDGEIDILAVTHEHYDHVSGFAHAKNLWKNKESLKIKQLWLPWIEKEGEAEADEVREKKKKLNKAAAKAVAEAAEAHRAGKPDEDDSRRELMIQSAFLGVDLSGAEEGFGVSVMQEAYDIAKSLGDTTVYCEPGDIRRLPGTTFNAYVLGPPHMVRGGVELKKGKRFFLKLLEDEEEMYSYRHIGLVPDAKPHGLSFSMSVDTNDDALAEALLEDADGDDFDRYCPFDRQCRVPYKEAMTDPFFKERYPAGAWWRVDRDWMGTAAQLALRAGDYTNNISLVLAFELPGSKRILLFPGDAQVGNWLSWHEISSWTGIDSTPPPDLTAKDLLNRVIFYKAGHHGSHNATIREKGLEMMALDEKGNELDMVAYVPVSVAVAHDVMNYCPMPFYPIMKRLQDKTAGATYLSNGQPLEPPYTGAKKAPTWLKVTHSTTMIEKKSYGKDFPRDIEGETPLYTQITIPDNPPGP